MVMSNFGKFSAIISSNISSALFSLFSLYFPIMCMPLNSLKILVCFALFLPPPFSLYISLESFCWPSLLLVSRNSLKLPFKVPISLQLQLLWLQTSGSHQWLLISVSSDTMVLGSSPHDLLSLVGLRKVIDIYFVRCFLVLKMAIWLLKFLHSGVKTRCLCCPPHKIYFIISLDLSEYWVF